MPITDKPELNKEVVSYFQSVGTGLKGQLSKFMEKKETPETATFSLVLVVLFAVIAGVLFYFLYKWLQVLETPENIATVARNSITAQTHYGTSNPARVGIRDYLMKLKQAGIPDSHLVLTNFYVSTVNAAGLFSPAVDGIASPEAVRLAVLGGARGFVLDIWPDMSPGSQFGPVIQTVESGSSWRRITLNSLPLGYVFGTLVQEAFELNSRPGYSDPLFLYLRFRGKPRPSTFEMTAQALSANFEQYRLPNMFNGCRNQAKLFSTPITDLLRKVVIVSNVKATGTNLHDYINVGPMAGVKVEYGVNEARSLTTDAIVQAKRIVLNNLTWVAPLSEDSANNWDIQPSIDLGIMFCAMNFWDSNDALKKYLSPDMFGKQSFLLKPEPLRYILTILPTPPVPVYPGWDGSPSSGTPNPPRELRAPSI